jgi:hypothetical protein
MANIAEFLSLLTPAPARKGFSKHSLTKQERERRAQAALPRSTQSQSLVQSLRIHQAIERRRLSVVDGDVG